MSMAGINSAMDGPKPGWEKRRVGQRANSPFPQKTDCYENIDQRNSTELGRRRASWGEYDAMQWKP